MTSSAPNLVEAAETTTTPSDRVGLARWSRDPVHGRRLGSALDLKVQGSVCAHEHESLLRQLRRQIGVAQPRQFLAALRRIRRTRLEPGVRPGRVARDLDQRSRPRVRRDPAECLGQLLTMDGVAAPRRLASIGAQQAGRSETLNDPRMTASGPQACFARKLDIRLAGARDQMRVVMRIEMTRFDARLAQRRQLLPPLTKHFLGAPAKRDGRLARESALGVDERGHEAGVTHRAAVGQLKVKTDAASDRLCRDRHSLAAFTIADHRGRRLHVAPRHRFDNARIDARAETEVVGIQEKLAQR